MVLILLVFLAALAVVALLRRSPSFVRKRSVDIGERMELAAKVCEAAARDSFRIHLDYSLESLTVLDGLIDREFKSNVATDDVGLVLAAYVGEVLVRQHKAKWLQPVSDEQPKLRLPDHAEAISPFELVDEKLKSPDTVSLAQRAEELFAPLPDVTDATAS